MLLFQNVFMTKTILSGFLALASVSFLLPVSAEEEGSGLNELTAEEKGEGWKLLFDGKSLDQWRNFKKGGLSDKWVVEDGAFTLTGKGGGDIISKDTYGAFEIQFEYKISEEGNSGFMYHVTDMENTPWKTGPEMQIQDHAKGKDPQKSGWLYQLYEADVDTTKPAGEWNHVHIKITPEECVHWVNGTKYFEYVKGSEDWNERVAKSKFSKFPHFGKPTEGHICFQDHGDVVSFRNVKIRPLDS